MLPSRFCGNLKERSDFGYRESLPRVSTHQSAEQARLKAKQTAAARSERTEALQKGAGRHACTATSILSFAKTGTPCDSLLTTKMNRWSGKEPLKQLIDGLQFAESLNYRLVGRLPKISLEVEQRILDKIFSAHTVAVGALAKRTGTPIFYRTSGGRYYNVVTNYPSGSTKEKAIYFDKKVANAVGAILSSSLFFWFQQVYSNSLDLKSYEIESFTVPAKSLTDAVLAQIGTLYAEYLADAERNAIRHETKSYAHVDSFKEYKIRKSKHLIDRIDDAIAPLYGLTLDEGAFIKDYEKEFRVGGGIE